MAHYLVFKHKAVTYLLSFLVRRLKPLYLKFLLDLRKYISVLFVMIYRLMGGFHMGGTAPDKSKEVISRLKDLAVEMISQGVACLTCGLPRVQKELLSMKFSDKDKWGDDNFFSSTLFANTLFLSRF